MTKTKTPPETGGGSAADELAEIRKRRRKVHMLELKLTTAKEVVKELAAALKGAQAELEETIDDSAQSKMQFPEDTGGAA